MRIYKTLYLPRDVTSCWILTVLSFPFIIHFWKVMNDFFNQLPFSYFIILFGFLPLLFIIVNLVIYTYENRNYKPLMGKYWSESKFTTWTDLPFSLGFGMLSLLVFASEFIDPIHLDDYYKILKWVGSSIFVLSVSGLIYSLKKLLSEPFDQKTFVEQIKINPNYLVFYRDNWIQEFDLTKVEDLSINEGQIEVKENSLSTKIDCRNFLKEDLEKLQDDFHSSKRIRSAHLHGGYSFKELIEQRANKHWEK